MAPVAEDAGADAEEVVAEEAVVAESAQDHNLQERQVGFLLVPKLGLQEYRSSGSV